MSGNFPQNILAAFSIGNISSEFFALWKSIPYFPRKDHQNFPQLFPSRPFPQNSGRESRYVEEISNPPKSV